MEPEFIRKRITELRMKNNVSELKMSRDLGRSDGYIHHIVSGKSLPSMAEFLNICDYLGVTPEYFFKERLSQPLLVQTIDRQLEDLNEQDLVLLLSLIGRIKKL